MKKYECNVSGFEDKENRYMSLSNACFRSAMALLISTAIPFVFLLVLPYSALASESNSASFLKLLSIWLGVSGATMLMIDLVLGVIMFFKSEQYSKKIRCATIEWFDNQLDKRFSHSDKIYESPSFRTYKVTDSSVRLCVCWDKEVAWLKEDKKENEKEVTSFSVAREGFFECKDVAQYNSILDYLGGNALEEAKL